MRYAIVLIIFLAIIWGLELLADVHAFPAIWWTHHQAMAYGGVAFIGLVLFLFVFRRR